MIVCLRLRNGVKNGLIFSMKLRKLIWQSIRIYLLKGNMDVKTWDLTNYVHRNLKSVHYVDYNGNHCELEFSNES